MALSDYIESLKEEQYTREVPFAKKHPPVAERLPRFASIQPTSTSGGRHRQGMIIPEKEKKKQQEEEGGMTHQQAWDAYQQYMGKGASEGVSSGTATSGTGSTAAYSGGYPVQGMAGGQATYGAAYPPAMATGTAPTTAYGTMATGATTATGTGATAAGSQGLGYMGGTGATATGSTAGAGAAGAGSAAMAAWIAAAVVAASYMQKQRDKEETSEDPGRGSDSQKARIMSAIGGPSILETLDDPISIPWTPLTALMGVDSGSKGDTESEGTKLWDWLAKLFS